jgi:hypothetical protein
MTRHRPRSVIVTYCCCKHCGFCATVGSLAKKDMHSTHCPDCAAGAVAIVRDAR